MERHLCPDYCPAISPREQDQTKEKEPHKCLRDGARLLHGRYHPRLMRTERCDNWLRRWKKFVSRTQD